MTNRNWLRGRKGSVHETELICLPHAGAGASAFNKWRGALHAEGFALRVVQYPGREDRLGESPIADFDRMVKALADALASELVDGHVLFGHSMGAMLAWALAVEMERRAMVRPRAVILSGCLPPSIYRPPLADFEISDGELVRRIADVYGSISPELLESPEMVSMLAEIIRSDLQVVMGWKRQAPAALHAPVLIYGGKHDERAPTADRAAWAAFLGSEVLVREFPGNHFFLFDQSERVLKQIADDCSCSRPLTGAAR